MTRQTATKYLGELVLAGVLREEKVGREKLFVNETLNRLRTYGSEEPRLEIKKAREGYPTSIAETLCAFSTYSRAGRLAPTSGNKWRFRVWKEPSRLLEALHLLTRSSGVLN